MIFSRRRIIVVFVLFCGMLFGACNVETAKAPSSKELIILSDYLLPKDTILFERFSNQQNVSLKIVSIETDKIIGLTRNNGFNTDGDIIMVKSLFNINKLNQRDILHNIDFSEVLTLPEYDQNNWSRNFIAFGYDPFVFANSKYGLINTYADLKRISFVNTVEKRDIPVLLSPVIKRFSKMDANKWIKKFTTHSISLDSLSCIKNDSIRLSLPILTTYSDFQTNKDTLLDFSHRRLKMSNNSSKGTFFNLRTFAILKNAKHYNSAKVFSTFYLKQKNNIELNNALNTVSLFNHKKTFKKYKTNTSELVQYYTTKERILNRLN